MSLSTTNQTIVQESTHKERHYTFTKELFENLG